jgi:hypothetical protein
MCRSAAGPRPADLAGPAVGDLDAEQGVVILIGKVRRGRPGIADHGFAEQLRMDR